MKKAVLRATKKLYAGPPFSIDLPAFETLPQGVVKLEKIF